jgi:hypothetical protein
MLVEETCIELGLPLIEAKDVDAEKAAEDKKKAFFAGVKAGKGKDKEDADASDKGDKQSEKDKMAAIRAKKD